MRPPQIRHNLASLYQEQSDAEAAVETYGAAVTASVALYGEGTRWATASRWKQANALAQLGRQVCGHSQCALARRDAQSNACRLLARAHCLWCDCVQV